MPLTITKKDGKFCVTDPDGKQFGCHATKKGAVNQIDQRVVQDGDAIARQHEGRAQ